MVFQESFAIHTRGHGDMQDLSDAVRRIVGQSGIKTGMAQVFVVGSTD